MNMKKMYFRLMMAMMGLVAVSLTSCDDEEIAKTLEGTWKGDMYISSEWDGHYYNATYTEVTFLKDPYAFSSGTTTDSQVISTIMEIKLRSTLLTSVGRITQVIIGDMTVGLMPEGLPERLQTA